MYQEGSKEGDNFMVKEIDVTKRGVLKINTKKDAEIA